ncbi:hypothetical protein [Streptomyces nanshensis]|uniref:Uncharacterized protein n=1 Tax=Streptomyces nanshensis TaxID=518642 RepID=A0A1E7L686_9ACTN|nr:hypothetical protein [Streptomyces nanshensis]OEV11523.1 hypothetical protein AN218_12530 [Streptomyces nanshensis]
MGSEFRGDLLPHESVQPYVGEQQQERGDWEFVTREGYGYRLTEVSCAPGQWQVARMPFRWSSSNGGYCWLGLDVDLERALAWIRRDGASRALAAGRWERHGHWLTEPVTFSVTLQTEELEEGVVLVRRFGRSGLLCEYRWGWEEYCSGALPENPDRKAYDHRFAARAWCATHAGLAAVPTERLRIASVDEERDEACAVGAPFVGKCKATDVRFVVEVLDEAGSSFGTVIVCGKHLMHRLTGDDAFGRDAATVAHLLAEEKGTWVDWQDRAYELSGELLTAALLAGEADPKPDVRAALYAGGPGRRRQARHAGRSGGSEGRGFAGQARGGGRERRGLSPASPVQRTRGLGRGARGSMARTHQPDDLG